MHSDHLAPANFRAAFLPGYFHFSIANDHDSLAGFIYFDAINSVAKRAHRDGRSINLHVTFSAFQYGIFYEPLRNLNLNFPGGHFRDVGFRVPGEAKDIREVELQFRARAIGRRNRVARHQRSIQR
jgi:hypothetical protein